MSQALHSLCELDAQEAFGHFMQSGHYCSIVLTPEFDFTGLMERLRKVSGQVNPPHPRAFTHYHMLINKDGDEAWRPMTLLHPVAYVSAVSSLTSKNVWDQVQERFDKFSAIEKVEASGRIHVTKSPHRLGIPVMAYQWVRDTERRSLALALEYDYMFKTDITNCYGSIARHHLEQAFSESSNALEFSLVLSYIMEAGQRGLPQGNLLSDFLAELFLGWLDVQLDAMLPTGVKVIRFRDDYRIFAENSSTAEHALKALSQLLAQHGMRLNPSKTKGSSTIILDGLKPDKAYWIANKRLEKAPLNWLLQIHLVALKYPQSGTLVIELNRFLGQLDKVKKEKAKRSLLEEKQIPSMCSVLAEIAVDNPRVIPECVTIISKLLHLYAPTDIVRGAVARKVINKLMRASHNSLYQLWGQKLVIAFDLEEIEWTEPLCRLLKDKTLKGFFNTHGLCDDEIDALENAQVWFDEEGARNNPISTESLKKAQGVSGIYLALHGEPFIHDFEAIGAPVDEPPSYILDEPDFPDEDPSGYLEPDFPDEAPTGYLEPDFPDEDPTGYLEPDFPDEDPTGYLEPDFPVEDPTGYLDPDFPDEDPTGYLDPDFADEAPSDNIEPESPEKDSSDYINPKSPDEASSQKH